jgi:hypothetical protein
MAEHFTLCHAGGCAKCSESITGSLTSSAKSRANEQKPKEISELGGSAEGCRRILESGTSRRFGLFFDL